MWLWGYIKKTGPKINRSDIPLHQKVYGLFRIPVGWAPSKKIMDFIRSLSVKLDMIQHDKHTLQPRELTLTGFLYFCFQEVTGCL